VRVCACVCVCLFVVVCFFLALFLFLGSSIVHAASRAALMPLMTLVSMFVWECLTVGMGCVVVCVFACECNICNWYVWYNVRVCMCG
jgi:hypothetical protein